jgi:hypothetical protein
MTTEHTSTDHLTDVQFIERFEDCTLPAAWFHHRDHIRLAWLQIKAHGLLEGLERISRGIKRFAAAQGKAERYHETITWAYAILVNERIARANPEQSWSEFANLNPDLLDWHSSILRNYYRPETLSSDVSRMIFVMPDKLIETR